MINNIIRVFSLLVAVLGGLNLLALALSAQIQKFLPAITLPAANVMEAVSLFGVGAGVYALSEIAKKTGGRGH